jgi:hypothetical protein
MARVRKTHRVPPTASQALVEDQVVESEVGLRLSCQRMLDEQFPKFIPGERAPATLQAFDRGFNLSERNRRSCGDPFTRGAEESVANAGIDSIEYPTRVSIDKAARPHLRAIFADNTEIGDVMQGDRASGFDLAYDTTLCIERDFNVLLGQSASARRRGQRYVSRVELADFLPRAPPRSPPKGLERDPVHVKVNSGAETTTGECEAPKDTVGIEYVSNLGHLHVTMGDEKSGLCDA